MKKSPQLRWLLLLVLCSSCELTLFTQTELERPPLPYLDYEGIGCLRLWADGSLVAVMNRTGFNTFNPTDTQPRVALTETVLIKTDTAGVVQWRKVIGPSPYNQPYEGPLMEALPGGGCLRVIPPRPG